MEAHSSHHKPRIIPLPDDDKDGGESDDSDKKSKMSFSYWGADKVALQKPVLKPKQHSVGGSSGHMSGRNLSRMGVFSQCKVRHPKAASLKPAGSKGVYKLYI